ncbi:RNA methyltransferase [Mesorhizobium sp. L-8-10]|uniref:class I SAM-dependent RNA methyltransferase n=1 Tax=Mesorhizobium sp. L-8-10 TaxID=2744523 RepID=UPI0019259218|nr:class I SAM-dependent RNA methyltransferase [Mesorhizobium sp. L-8-10]BCH34150.1 RNA methyltransferase [Mesorhizobium sp. L-8-10]
MTARFVIDRLGAKGDGIAETGTGQVFIPFTLPGETVTAAREKDRATLMAVLEASPLRAEPVCSHFTECGGCDLQHFEGESYRAWKREKVVHALKGKGIDVPVAATVACAPASRRRVVFSARRTEAGMILGYNRALSHTIIDITECPIAAPEIVAALPRLRSLASLICMTPQPFHLAVTLTASGLDVAADGSGKLSETARRKASDFVIREGIARLSVDGEIVVEPRKPVVMFGDAAVTPPPGGFLQAVASAEEAMAGLVAAHLGKAKRIADLFAGAGAFALRLATKAEIHAVEADAAPLAALDRGFRFARGLKRITAERRDLYRRPMTFKELNAFDAVVFDPPRAGAEDQSKQIARSDVPLVAAVSCNPVTLARDLRILIDGGYSLKCVTPIDQFLWSAHVEAVALLEKPRRRR